MIRLTCRHGGEVVRFAESVIEMNKMSCDNLTYIDLLVYMVFVYVCVV